MCRQVHDESVVLHPVLKKFGMTPFKFAEICGTYFSPKTGGICPSFAI